MIKQTSVMIKIFKEKKERGLRQEKKEEKGCREKRTLIISPGQRIQESASNSARTGT